MNTQEYFKSVEKETRRIYAVAEEARKKNLDPVRKVEIPLAKSLAEKVVGLISAVYPQMQDAGIDKRILELEKEHGKLDSFIAFKIAEEVARQKFCQFSTLVEAIEAGTRTGFAYLTLGVVSSPIEGFTKLELKKTNNGKDYFCAYFSGPIRSAGTTASCLVLMLIDYLREMFGYAPYDPTEDEIKRYVTENHDYHERVTNLQYMPTDEEIIFLASHLPIQIDGEPTEKLEVSNYKNLSRIGTNNVRGGMALIFSEGLAQKAAKGFRYLNRMKQKGLKSSGFDFLAEYIELHEKRDKGKTDNSPTYINDIVAGRPIFGHPSRSGAFRFRYGRGRNNGFSGVSIHPATMEITDGFIANGTQLKLERPTKGCVVTSCDVIEGPIVRFKNGSVRKMRTPGEARKAYSEIDEIIYLGDVLFPFSDVANRNSKLVRPGYVEEIWALELREKAPDEEKKINYFSVDFEETIRISKEWGISLHPSYIFYWTEISKEELMNLLSWLRHARLEGKIILPYTREDKEKYSLGKRALELLGVEHEVTVEHVVIAGETSKALLLNLGVDWKVLETEGSLKDFLNLDKFDEEKPILEIINQGNVFQVRDKAGEFIGARMGRPEKAKLRKLIGSPNALFPVGNEGGRLRSFQAACEAGNVFGDFPAYSCDKCKKETIYPSCEICGASTRKMFYCFDCKELKDTKCVQHERSASHYSRQIDINHYFKDAAGRLGLSANEVPSLVKGVRGTSSQNHATEHLVKGILRAKFDLQVNKDGTIRFDATELPLISFKPKEVGVRIEKLREIGYTHDAYGVELTREDQILELKPHDILLPSTPGVPEAMADDIFMRIADFCDTLLEKFYGLPPIYSLKTREDLVGQLGVCMAPHNCAGVVCRIVGFANALGLYASPYMHAAIRRDCDGDEAAIMLLGDVLLNFSREFLPSHRGGTQDSPLVLNAKIDAGEVDEQILDFELVNEYPLELYRKAEEKKHSSEIKVYDVRAALKEGRDPFTNIGFTHDTTNINDGVVCSNYKVLATMQDKVRHQMELVEKIRATDTADTARLVIERHFLRDLRGNLRKFSMQEFRCVGCNEIMRRPPLAGVCPRCQGKIIFTTHEGGVKKYLEPALEISKKYNLSSYVQQSIELTKRHIDSVFGKELEMQESLGKWF